MLVCAGLVIESVADWQLSRFKAQPRNRGKVLAVGLWRYSRHPNYFGDFCVWWGFYLIALGAGAGGQFPGPLLMTIFLFEVSGVALLNETSVTVDQTMIFYVRQTNAFFPGLPRTQQFSEVKNEKEFMVMLLLGSSSVFGNVLDNDITDVVPGGVEASSWEFDVYLDSRKIGFHEFEVTQNGEGYEMSTRAEFDVKVLFVNFYSYRQ